MNLLIIDTETTGVDAAQDSVIEIGAVLYSCPYQTTLFQISFLLCAQDNPAEGINRIPPSALKCLPAELQQQSLQMLQSMAAQATYVVAHNADFDRQWFDDIRLPVLKNSYRHPLKWLCTMSDMTWPRQNRPGESLVNLALNHGIGIGSAHRALTDCQLIAELFNRITQDELASLVKQAVRPKAFFRANVSYDDRHLAKEAGFQWYGQEKMWARWIAKEDAARLPFSVACLMEAAS